MARIGNDRMIVRGEYRDDGSWLFTVCYTAQFSSADLGKRFDDSVQILSAHESAHPAEFPTHAECPVSFTATGPRVFRKKRIVVRPHEYDTGAGLDAVCAWITLHRAGGPGPIDDEQRTPALVPSLRPSDRPRAVLCSRALAQSLRC